VRIAVALTALLAASSARADLAFDVAEVQGIMAFQRVDAWLLYDFRGQNPIAGDAVLGARHGSRRWFYLVPARGEPVMLISKIEAHLFERLPGRRIEYASWRELESGLKELLKGNKRIAMEYSPGASLPALSRVDAGTLEQIKKLKVEIVSSAELVQAARSRWGKEGRASHYLAVHHLTAVRDDAMKFIQREVKAGRRVTEWDVQQRIVQAYAARGLEGDPPIVASGANTANPHYEPTQAGGREIRPGDLVLLDLWARQKGVPRAIYADMTWMAFVGDTLPRRFADAFSLVARARDEAVAMVRKRLEERRPVRGFEVDQVARDVITKGGMGDRFIHRTGHSIDTRVHGDGVNLDDFETHDTRSIIMGVGFSVEPGVYIPGEFGVRSEIDCHVTPQGLEITTPLQKEITLLP
jgi:Xaa-Pro aminopeptidase